MSKRTTLVLAVLAAALAVYIVAFERHGLSSSELQGRAGRLLPRFVRDRVTELVMQPEEGKSIVLRRERDGEAQLGEWKLRKPIEAQADPDAVDSLLGKLEWAEPYRTLEGIGKADRKRFGLDAPRIELTYAVADEQHTLALGGDAPSGDGVYAQGDDPSKAYVVGTEVLEALDRDVGHFRSKDLLPGVDVRQARRVVLEHNSGRRVLERRDGRWWITVPNRAIASKTTVQDLLTALEELEAERFEAEEPSELQAFGLGEASTAVRIEGKPAGEQAEPWTRHVRIGGPCGSHEGERYARVEKGPVVCVRAEALRMFERPASAFREARLLSLEETGIERVELEGASGRAELRRSGEGWELVSGGSKRSADPEAVSEWLTALQGVRAEKFVPLQDGASARGLEQPAAVVRMYGEGDEVRAVLKRGRTEQDAAWAQRDDEPFALKLPAKAATLFETHPVRFQERQLIAEPDRAAVQLEVERSGGEGIERAVRDGQGWRLQRPIHAPADSTILANLTRQVGSLEAKRFVAPRARPEHGLREPRYVLRARFEGAPSAEAVDGGVAADGSPDGGEKDTRAHPPRQHVLRIGDDTRDGAFAQLDDEPAVFVVPDALTRRLAEPWIDRALLSTETKHLAAVRITRGPEVLEVQRDAEGALNTTEGAPLARKQARRLVQQVASLRIERVTGYGEAPREHGLADPKARVTVRRQPEGPEPQDYTFVLGATEGEGAGARTHVRRTDLDVGLAIDAAVAKALINYPG
jgi:hypothetical protein